MSDQKFVTGLYVDYPHENAPDFVKAKISVQSDRFVEWLNEQGHSDKGYVYLDIKESKGGKLYASLNDFKPVKKAGTEKEDLVSRTVCGSADVPDEQLPF